MLQQNLRKSRIRRLRDSWTVRTAKTLYVNDIFGWCVLLLEAIFENYHFRFYDEYRLWDCVYYMVRCNLLCIIAPPAILLYSIECVFFVKHASIYIRSYCFSVGPVKRTIIRVHIMRYPYNVQLLCGTFSQTIQSLLCIREQSSEETKSIHFTGIREICVVFVHMFGCRKLYSTIVVYRGKLLYVQCMKCV